MGKHLNKKIGMLGQKIVCNYLKRNQIDYWTNFDDNWNITDIIMHRDKRVSFIEVSTKQHTVKNGMKVTGKNKKQIDNYLKRQTDLNIDYFIIFVDIKTKTLYGNNLNNLVRGTTYGGKKFPMVYNCGGQVITFFSLNDMLVLGKLTDDDVDKLSEIAWRNKFNKHQTNIYDNLEARA